MYADIIRFELALRTNVEYHVVPGDSFCTSMHLLCTVALWVTTSQAWFNQSKIMLQRSC